MNNSIPENLNNSNNNEGVFPNQVLNINNIPKNLKPFDFINFYQNNFSSLFTYQQYNSIFNKKDYKENNPQLIKYQFRFPPYEFMLKEQLSQRLFKNNTFYPTAISLYGDEIYIGDSNGIIHKYSFSNEYEYITFTHKFSNNQPENITVKSLDCSKDGKYIISGYSNGIIIIWEKTLGKEIYINDDVFKTSIVVIKFIRNKTNSKFEFAASDLNGGLFKICLVKGYLWYNSYPTDLNSYIDSKRGKSFKNRNDPAFIIEVYQFLNSKINNKNIIITVFGTINEISVFIIYPHIECFFIIEKPKFVIDDHIAPDISIGEAYYPKTKQNPKKEAMETTILAIAWEKYIRLYSIEFTKTKEGNPHIIFEDTPNSHFSNKKYSIIRIGFITKSILFILDSSKNFKILNTFLFHEDDFKEENLIAELSNLYDEEAYGRAIITEGQLIENEIFADQFEFKKEKFYYSYRPFIFPSLYMITFLSNQRFFYLKLFDFKEYIHQIIEENFWEEALKLGLDLYSGRILTFTGLPMNKKDRMNLLTDVLKEIISNYIHFMLTSSFKQEEIDQCLDNVINLCFSLNEVYYLLNDIIDSCQRNGYGDLIIQHIEPLILKDEFKTQKLPESFLTNLFSFYLTKKEFVKLSHLFTHFTYDSTNINTVLNLSAKYFLFHTLDYLFEINKESEIENKFTLIQKIFDEYIQAKKREAQKDINIIKDEKNNNIIYSFEDILINYGIEEFEKSKEFLGEYLLWYINVCIDKCVEYFNNKMLVFLIFIWLISHKIFTELITFDSYSFLNLLYKIVTTDEIISIISKININYTEREEQLFEDTIMRCPMYLIMNLKVPRRITIKDYQDIEGIINHIISTGESFSSIYILHDLNIFRAKISLIYPKLFEDGVIIQTIENIITFINKVENSTKEEIVDVFKSHVIQRNCNKNKESYIRELSELINSIIEEQIEIFNEEEKRKLIMISKTNNFPLVAIKFLEIECKYKDCLDIKLNNIKVLYNDKLKIFEWINNSFKNIKKELDKKTLNEQKNTKKQILENERDLLKQKILEKFDVLSEISIEKTASLIYNWYDDYKKVTIIKSINHFPTFQLTFLENLFQSHLSLINKGSLLDESEEEDYGELFFIFIQLLITLNKKKQILGWLKKINLNYPIQNILTICKNANDSLSCVYLYLKLDEINEAFELSIKQISHNANKLKSNSNIDDKYKNRINKLRYWIDKAIQICDISSEKEFSNINSNIHSNSEQMWFKLFNLVKELYEIVKEDKSQLKNEISFQVGKVLLRMFFYFPLNVILNKMGDIQYEELKILIMKVLKRFSNFEVVLSTTKNLLENSIVEGIEEFKDKNTKGYCLKLEVCDYCRKDFNSPFNENIITFSCGHKVHRNCALKKEKSTIICELCDENEIVENLARNNQHNEIRSLINKRRANVISLESSINDGLEENMSSSVQIKHRIEKLKIMKSYEKHHSEMESIINK